MNAFCELLKQNTPFAFNTSSFLAPLALCWAVLEDENSSLFSTPHGVSARRIQHACHDKHHVHCVAVERRRPSVLADTDHLLLCSLFGVFVLSGVGGGWVVGGG